MRTAQADASAAPGQGFAHEALFFGGDAELLAGIVPFVAGAVAAGEPALVALPAEHLDLVRTALGADADRVSWLDMRGVGANPARIIPTWADFLADHGGTGSPVRGVGEPIWAGRTADELVECQHHEALLNLAFAGCGPFTLLCPYDLDTLSSSVIDEARRSHPRIRQHGRRHDSHSYVSWGDRTLPTQPPLRHPPASAARLEFAATNLADVRDLVLSVAGPVLDAAGAADQCLAAHEVAANSVLHGGGRGTARAWRDGRSVVVEIRDRGHLADPLAGRRRPGRDGSSGRGLWMANHVCALVQIRSDEDGTVVRLHQHAT